MSDKKIFDLYLHCYRCLGVYCCYSLLFVVVMGVVIFVAVMVAVAAHIHSVVTREY